MKDWAIHEVWSGPPSTATTIGCRASGVGFRHIGGHQVAGGVGQGARTCRNDSHKRGAGPVVVSYSVGSPGVPVESPGHKRIGYDVLAWNMTQEQIVACHLPRVLRLCVDLLLGLPETDDICIMMR